MNRTLGVVMFAFFAAIASAAPTIEFHSTGSGGHSGSISYDPRFGLGGGTGGIGTGSSAVGQGIDVDYLFGIGTVHHAGIQAKCFSCVMDFQTGAATNDSSAAGDSWSFSGGGYFRVTGGLDLNGDGIFDPLVDVPAGTVLLTGVFNTPVNVTAPISPDLKFTSATLINTMDNRVDAYFGTPGQGAYDGYYSQTFESARARLNTNPAHPNYNRWRFSTYTATGSPVPTGMMDGSVINTLVVPEPVSVLLSATAAGILLFCMRGRRRVSV